MAFRYQNPGNANDLLVEANFIATENSLTGYAFYQTVQQKSFNIPATNELWIKFDVYFDGVTRWRAFNGADNAGSDSDVCGVTAQADGRLDLLINSATVQSLAGAATVNASQTILLHMTNTLAEVWTDGEKIFEYTGELNSGEPFDEFYLQSDGAGTFFSNVIISDSEIFLGEGQQRIFFDVETYIRNAQKGWRVYNLGDADFLSSGTNVKPSRNQSVTGKAFTGGARADMFDTPADTYEVWLRFDVYFASTTNSLIYAGNWSPTLGKIFGARFEISSAGKIFLDGTEQLTALPNQLHQCLLHISSASGLIEFTLDGTTITFSGNVNDGEPLENLCLCSEGDGVLFSNIVVSDTLIDLTDGHHRIDFAVETKIFAPVVNIRREGTNKKFLLYRKKVKPSIGIHVGDKNFFLPLNTENATVASAEDAASSLVDFLVEEMWSASGVSTGDTFNEYLTNLFSPLIEGGDEND